MHLVRTDIIKQLQREILAIQSRKSVRISNDKIIFGKIESAFPECRFPTGAVHEFISYSLEATAATNGFISAISSKLMKQGGTCLWVSTKRTVFPPTLKLFGIDPASVIFIDISRAKEALWATEEALRCDMLAAVVSEIPDLTFNQSRRLQLAVEESHVTGFVHRQNPRIENITACVSRWKINPIRTTHEYMPGISFPRWNVDLVKVRNGKSGTWQIEWVENEFNYIMPERLALPALQTRKAG